MGKDAKVFVELVIVLVLVALGIWSLKQGPVPALDTNQAVNFVEDTSSGSIDANNPAAPLSYQQALVKYSGARIQLDKNCQASPDKMTFKNNTNVMIDNRAPVIRTVKVGSTFSVRAYGFKIVRLYSTTLPATWYVNCDSSRNVSTILIQR